MHGGFFHSRAQEHRHPLDGVKNNNENRDSSTHMDHNRDQMHMGSEARDGVQGEEYDMQEDEMNNMSHSFSLHLPMNRNGSGTGWLPDHSPMYGRMLHSRKWMYMCLIW